MEAEDYKERWTEAAVTCIGVFGQRVIGGARGTDKRSNEVSSAANKQASPPWYRREINASLQFAEYLRKRLRMKSLLHQQLPQRHRAVRPRSQHVARRRDPSRQQ